MIAVVLAVACAGAAAEQVDPMGTGAWQALRLELCGDAPVVFDERMRVVAPDVAENPLRVPVAVSVDPSIRATRFLVFTDYNPILRVLAFEPRGARAYLGFRVKMQQSGPVRAAVRDDLRNVVWMGSCMGNAVCDVMLHVPVDEVLMKAALQVRIFGPYHLEGLAVARNLAQVPQVLGLDAYTRIATGVETGSLADDYLMSALGGRFRENLRHYRSLAEAVTALREGEVQAVVGTQSQIEAALGGASSEYPVAPFGGAGLSRREWPLGLAVKREDADLAEALDQALLALEADGELGRIFERHGVRHAAVMR
jgi:predicted secreted protein